MTKKMLSLVLVFCLALAVMPMTAFALTDDEKLAIAESVCDTSWYTANPDATEFHISSAAQLWGLAYYGLWQNYVSFEGKTIYIDADIDLAGFPDWITPYTSLTNYAFKGTLDGQNHVISNLTGATFFGAVINSTLKNICISDANISGGSILAIQLAVSGVIDNCIVSGKAIGGNGAGAITGTANGIVTNCISMAEIIANTNSGAGGLVYIANNANAVITNNAVLNYSVIGKRPESAKVIGRVVGYTNMAIPATLSGNVAYDATIVQDQTGNDITITSDAAGRDGQSISKAEIYSSGILNRLPASFPIPEYLASDEPVVDPVNVVDVVLAAPSEPFGVVDFQFKAYLPANKVNLIEAVFSYYGDDFDATATSLLENAPVSLVRVDPENHKITLVLGVANDGAIAYDEIAYLANITTKVKAGMTPESSALKLESVNAYSKGELVECGVVTGLVTSAVTYRAPLDVNGDGQIDLADLSIVLYYFGAKTGDANWDEASFADVNGDGIVDTIDVTTLIEAIYGA